MTLRMPVLLFVVSTSLACSAPPPEVTDAPQVGVFEEAACPMPVPEGVVEGETLRCGYVTVPEVHDEPGERTVRLAVAVFSALGEDEAADPLVVAPPGPGTSPLISIGPDVAGGVGQPLRAQRDVVLVENRGLVLSEPALMCDEKVEAAFAALERDPSGAEPIEDPQVAVSACYERLEKEGVNLRAFTFEAMADDLAMVMTALGYDTFNVYGTSAGTVVAQHLLRDHPQRLRSVVIDSSVPLGRKTLQAEMPANAARIMHALFEACAEDAACAAAYPDLEARFDEVIAGLNRKPVAVAAKHPRTGEEIAVFFDGTRLAGGLVMAASQTPVIPQVPGLIHALSQGSHDGLKHIAWSAMPPPGDFAHGLSLAALCADYNTFGEEDLLFDGRFPAYEAAVADMSWGPKSLIADCAAFGFEKVDPGARKVATSDVPTLILAGQLDVMTPPAWAHDTAGTLGNAHVFEVPGYGHSPTFSGPCPASMALAFFADPSQAPDASCLAEMKIAFAVPGEG
jgi:pimeloyl-ACP methyl ester carboxylesterase